MRNVLLFLFLIGCNRDNVSYVPTSEPDMAQATYGPGGDTSCIDPCYADLAPIPPADMAQPTPAPDLGCMPDLKPTPDLKPAPDLSDDDDENCGCNGDGHGHGNGHCKYDCE
jgi:hypothetical protein